jgi:hypothetical protein
MSGPMSSYPIAFNIEFSFFAQGAPSDSYRIHSISVAIMTILSFVLIPTNERIGEAG